MRGPDVVAAARAGDTQAKALVTLLGWRLGVGIANAINTFDPEVVVIGGGVATAGDLLLGPVRESARRFTVPASAKPPRSALPAMAPTRACGEPRCSPITSWTRTIPRLRPSAEDPQPSARQVTVLNRSTLEASRAPNAWSPKSGPGWFIRSGGCRGSVGGTLRRKLSSERRAPGDARVVAGLHEVLEHT